jgi:hypothetical protein
MQKRLALRRRRLAYAGVMGTIALKLTLTPILILAASLASRRWGQAIGGWLVALPLTTGPVTFFLALEQGERFAARAAEGALAGAGAEACFALAYGIAAGRSAAVALLAASASFAVAGMLLQVADLPVWAQAPLTAGCLALALWLMPRRAAKPVVPLRPPGWDLPARMMVATSLVLVLTTVAPLLGPHLSGILATFPIFGTVLAFFAHRQQGPAAARQVLTGLCAGLYGFAAFFLVLGLTMEKLGIATGFLAASAATLAVHAVSWRVLRRREPSGGA